MNKTAIISSILLTLKSDSTSVAAAAANSADNLKLIATFLSGGALGSVITIIYNRIRNRIQTMECHYIDDNVISQLPVTVNETETHQNIYSKEFVLTNTTNIDHKEFRVIFEFDVTAKIIRSTDTTKGGIDRLKKKLLKPNEFSVIIKNFNRNDKATFTFQIANVTEDLINITEDNCTGFKITMKDKRQARLKSKMTQVDKGRLTNTSR